MEYSNSKEIEEEVAVVDIESGEAIDHNAKREHTSSSNNWGKASLNKLVVGVLGLSVGEPSGGSVDEKTELLVDKKNPGRQESHLKLVDEEHDKERRKAGKAKKAPKPPRPPRGPSLDAADMRFVKEISKIAIKRRERSERVKALRKMKEARLPSTSTSSSPSLSSSGGTISAMLITVFFFLVLIFQGLSSDTSSNLKLMGAPQPAPETTDFNSLQFYKTVMWDDGAAPSFVPPRSVE